jgi:hypothetical protein
MKNVLITGASTGIGFELAKVFAKNGFNLILVARNEEKLKEISSNLASAFKITTEFIVKDLSRIEAADELFENISSRNIEVDVLVNNAGFGLFGEFKDTDLNREVEMINLNITSLVKLTKLFLPSMIKRKSGRIMNVASVASFQPGPLMSIYYATKSFVLHFSEAVSFELKNSGVTVSTLCPGPTLTEFQSTAKLDRSKLFSLLKPMSAEEVALIGYNEMMNGKTIILPGLLNKLSANSHRFFPRRLVNAVTYYIQSEK